MIEITLDQQKLTVKPKTTLEDLLSTQQNLAEPFACAVNKTFIPKSQYQHTTLAAGDSINIVMPQQGG